jgi:hypothetical protein
MEMAAVFTREDVKIAATAKIIGADNKEIHIISRCPVCGFVYGIVPPDRGAIYYNPAYIDISKEDFLKIPPCTCLRECCPAYELEVKKIQPALVGQ